VATDFTLRLTEDVRARVAGLAAGDTAPVPKHASTVVLLRDVPAGPNGPAGVEACLLRRVRTMAFAAGMHVFPGGVVDSADAHRRADENWVGPEPGSWAQVLSADDVGLARALVCAAVRETFEESGVLLAGPDATAIVDTDPVADPSWEADRQGLIDRSFSLSELLARRGLVLRADLLRPWAHWVTPEAEPKRYDTRFFVAAMPAAQATRDVGGESDRMVWLRPQTALDLHTAGELAMLPPTAFTLAELTGYAGVDEVLAAANERDIRPVLPRVVVTGEQAELLLPGDPGYVPDASRASGEPSGHDTADGTGHSSGGDGGGDPGGR
jgi:8-oxo-dGTP pyrophosphatase MutT (NUDIX family)